MSDPAPGFWDDPSIKPESTGYKKFEAVGDTLTGTIAKLSKRTFNAGEPDERTVPEFAFTEEDVPNLTAGQVLLQSALFSLRPEIGDQLTVTYAAMERRGTRTLKLWRVELKRRDGSTDLIDQTT